MTENNLIAQYNSLHNNEVSKRDIQKICAQALTDYERTKSDLSKTIYDNLSKAITSMNGKKKAKLLLTKLNNNKAFDTTTMPGFTRADQIPEKPANTFNLHGEIGKFLGTQQRFKLVITITGDFHGGKSEFIKQVMDAFADIDMNIGMFDMEQGGLTSKDTVESLKRNVKSQNLKRIQITGTCENGLDTIKQYANKFDVIVIDSGNKLGMVTNDWLDELREEFPETIFIVIFQQNAEGKVRGGSAADFDAPVALKAHRVDWTDFKKNYVSIKKNRGNRTDLKYMIADKKTLELIPDQNEAKI